MSTLIGEVRIVRMKRQIHQMLIPVIKIKHQIHQVPMLVIKAKVKIRQNHATKV